MMNLVGFVQMAFLVILANIIPQPRLQGARWKLLLSAYTAFWTLISGAWSLLLLQGDLPQLLDVLGNFGGLFASGSYFAAALVLFFLNYRAATEVNDRRRIRILIAGLAPGLLALALLPVLGWLPRRFLYIALIPLISLFFFFPAAFAYALLKHRLFDIRVIVRRGLQYALAKGSLAALIVIPLLGVLVHLYQNRVRSLGEVLSANAVAYLSAGAVLTWMLIKRQDILKGLDRRFFREAYDPREVHLEIARLLAKRDDLERDSQHLTAVLVRALHAGYGALLLRSKSSGPFRASFLLPGETGETPFPAGETPAIPSGSRLPGLLELTGKPLEVDLADTKSFLLKLPQADQELVRSWRAGLLAPVGETAVEAMLVLGEKLSEQPYSQEDIKLVEAVGLDFTAAYFSGTAVRQRAGERMRECPRCGLCCSEDTESCPNDGAALLDSSFSMAVAGRYRLMRRLGVGGMGVVYLATDAELGRQVAVKVIRPDSLTHENALERFRREARSAASLSHPNVVAVFDFGNLPGGGAFLVMEYLEGQTLRQVLRSESSLAARGVLEILDGVVAALDAAHRSGMVHRDLKPENVMVSRDSTGRSRIKVLDFGLAKNIATDQETLTQAGQLAGTLAYMAPEQLHGGNIDARTDIYALAVMSHEMLTGIRPEQGRALEGSWRAVLDRALGRRADSRHPTVGEFYQELRLALEQPA
jgi:tRNA A-37 threonylcarbamoyl transferase component Bud32